MTIMVLGLIVFLGAHSVRIVAEDWRNAQIQRLGEGVWKGLYSLVSIAGLVAVIWGFGMARADPVILWQPPLFLRHVTSLLMIPAFIFLVAAYVPRNHIKARLGHPMLLAVKTWALAHLLVNGRLSELILFIAFLAWAVMDFKVARRREPPKADGGGSTVATAGTVAGGLAATAVFAIYLHTWLIGVPAVGVG